MADDVVGHAFSHGFHPQHVAEAGSLPDLRYATANVHKQFSSIVLAGARESRGMPSFKDLLNETQVRAIEAYVLSRAEESAHPTIQRAIVASILSRLRVDRVDDAPLSRGIDHPVYD